MMAARGSATAQGTVMDTRLARTPLRAWATSCGFFRAMWMQGGAGASARSKVVTPQRAAFFMYTKARVETGLRPYLPNQRCSSRQFWVRRDSF
jgi:hypothetical protein